MADPKRWLGEIQRFFMLPGPGEGEGWVERAATLIRGTLPLRLSGLDAEEQRRLVASCLPGSRLLSGAGLADALG